MSGRNVALKQTVSLANQLKSSAWHAVDGDTGQGHRQTSCAYSDHQDSNSSWTIEFDYPVQIYSMTVYTVDDKISCPRSFSLVIGAQSFCYIKKYPLLNYPSARTWCRRLGGDLVMFKTRAMWNTYKVIVPRVGCWIGLTDVAKEGDWRWIDGQKPTFTRWYYGHPKHKYSDIDCAATSSRKWFSATCSKLSTPCCVTEPFRQMEGFILRGYDESSKQVYSYQASDKGMTRFEIYDVTPAIRRLKLELTQSRQSVLLCELEAYGETLCPEGTFGPECNFSCFCVSGPCTPTGWCENGCATGYDEPYCLGCPEGYFKLPGCQFKCSVNCIGVCDTNDGACLEGCISGYWGHQCNRNCSDDCPVTCNSITGQCPRHIEQLTEGKGVSLLLIAIVLLLLLLCCIVTVFWNRMKKTIRRMTITKSKSPGKNQQPDGGPDQEETGPEPGGISSSAASAMSVRTRTIGPGETEITYHTESLGSARPPA